MDPYDNYDDDTPDPRENRNSNNSSSSSNRRRGNYNQGPRYDDLGQRIEDEDDRMDDGGRRARDEAEVRRCLYIGNVDVCWGRLSEGARDKAEKN
jgi:hypothetical protein